MKKFADNKAVKYFTRLLGIGLGILAIYFSFKNVSGNELTSSLRTMNLGWLAPIILVNFVVIAAKAYRWQIMTSPVKRISFLRMFKVLTIGFMANCVLPARMGEAVRIHMLGKNESLSRITTTGTVVADRIIEGVSFLIMAGVLVAVTTVPDWIHFSLIATVALTVVLYVVAVLYSKKRVKRPFFIKLQHGFQAMNNARLTAAATAVSLLSWLLQGVMLYMTQIAFDVHLPLWGIVLVILAVNFAVSIPSTPGYIGTFEYACILAYTYLGADKATALLIGATFHLLQLIPVTLVGGIMILWNQLRPSKQTRLPGDREVSRWQTQEESSIS